MIDNLDNSFTPKHKRLHTYAAVANLASLIVVIIYSVIILSQLWLIFMNAEPDFPIASILFKQTGALLAVLHDFIQGAVYWCVLKGISLGLNMILETDLNYRDQSQEVHNE